jgi:hypothetical protein
MRISCRVETRVGSASRLLGHDHHAGMTAQKAIINVCSQTDHVRTAGSIARFEGK